MNHVIYDMETILWTSLDRTQRGDNDPFVPFAYKTS